MKVFYRGMSNCYWNEKIYDVYFVEKKATISDIEEYAENLGWIEWSTYEGYFLKRGVAPSRRR